jgi:hypothetical protein
MTSRLEKNALVSAVMNLTLISHGNIGTKGCGVSLSE